MAQQQDMGLFGIPSASDILRQQQQQDQMLAMRQAQLAPGQGLIYQAASAGQRAGRSIAGLFGIEDPALKEAAEMDAVKKAVASQWDGQDPEKALQLFADEANKRGLTQQALSATFKLQSMKADREKAELGKQKTQADIGLTNVQTEVAKKASERAAAQEARTAEEFDYKKSQRALDEATRQLVFVAKVQDINTRNTAAETAQLSLDKAKAELAAMPEGFYKRQYELKLEKLEADIKAARALATYREGRSEPGVGTRKYKIGEVPIRNDMGEVVGKVIVYSDGTRETVYGTAPPSSEDTASQTAKGMATGSTNILEQLKQPLLAEKKRREEERKRQQTGAK